MHSLLIVDDECMVVDGLAFDIDWSDIGIGEIFRAYDAEHAMELLERNRIDVIISDIRMPEMDGLKLTGYIRTRWPFSKVILISGYDEFEYAQKAIDLKVFSYVTKPISYDRIKHLVKQALDEIEDELKRNKDFEDIEKKLEEAIPVMQERLLNMWIVHGCYDPCKDVNRWRNCRLPLDPKKEAFLLMIRIDSYNPDFLDEEGIFDISMQSTVRRVLSRGNDLIFFRTPEDNFVVLLQGEKDALMEHQRYIEEMSEALQDVVAHTLQCNISIFIGDIAQSLSGLHGTYQVILEGMRRSILLDPGIIIHCGLHQKMMPLHVNVLDVLRQPPSYLFLLQALNRQGAIEKIGLIFEEAKKKQLHKNNIILDIHYHVAASLLQASAENGIAAEEWAGEDICFLYSIEKLKIHCELKAIYLRLTEKYMDFIIRQGRQHVHSIVEKVKNLVLQDIGKVISVSDIADRLHYNRNYLARLFKRETGLSITDYIIQLKIEHAKELLIKPGVKIYEVAEQCGYESITSFTSLFKREAGFTPKEFQNSRAAIPEQERQ